MLGRYRGRGFYDPLNEMNRLVSQIFIGGLPQRAETGQQGTQAARWVSTMDVVQRNEDLWSGRNSPGRSPRTWTKARSTRPLRERRPRGHRPGRGGHPRA